MSMNSFESTVNRRRSMPRFALALALIFLWAATSYSQTMEVPVKLQLALLFKILTFDRNFKERVGDEVVIAVGYQEKHRRSLDAKDELLRVVKESSLKRIEDIPFRLVSIDMDDTNLAGAISRNKVDILYITPLRAAKIETITDVSRAKEIMTVTGVPDYVEAGCAVGIGTEGEKPLIIINLPAAKAEGTDFSSQLLKLAKVVE